MLANGSDAPIEELDPLAGIRAGVLRTLDERTAWRPEQAVTVEEALHATCVAPAWLTGDERRRGKLLPGYLADLVVFDRDPVTCPPEELPEVQVVATMVGGRWLHNPPPLGLVRCQAPDMALSGGYLQVGDSRSSPLAASMPSGMCSTRRRSFGEWMFPSGRSKPVRIVGMF